MINFKKIIADKIAKTVDLSPEEIGNYIEVPPNPEMGDYAFPCFRLAKTLKKSPQEIAAQIKEKMECGQEMQEVKIAGGYLNFFIKPLILVENVLKEIDEKQDKYGSSDCGNGKNILVEYSSPNIAKPFHIGHLRNTIIGNSLYKIYQFLGYHTIGINHLGDYGTQFGKLIEGYKKWGSEYDLDQNPIEELTKIYVRISDLCKEDETVLEAARENFRKLEEGNAFCIELWKKFREISLKEFQKIYHLLEVEFDSWKGESFYIDKIPEVEKRLQQAGVVTESEGAQIVDLEEKGLGVCIIRKADGSTIYAIRDLAAILYRAQEYDFDKCLYVVAYEQNLHFRQIFEVAHYLGLPEKCVKGLEHVRYGMTRLTTGKMSTREGTAVKVDDLLKEAISRVEKIIEEKNPEMPNKAEEAQKIGIGAVIFNNLCTNIIKDQLFDWDTALNFNGETGPYIQYVYVRTNSVLEKASQVPSMEEVDFALLTDQESLKVISNLYNFQDILKAVVDKNEPSLLARYLINLSQSYSNFYNENKIISDDENLTKARLYLTKTVGIVLKTGCSLLGIKMPNKM